MAQVNDQRFGGPDLIKDTDHLQGVPQQHQFDQGDSSQGQTRQQGSDVRNEQIGTQKRPNKR